ncbi:UDP-diphospho-muramoylpentapeptide beta-N-acetylglucosaminyltransferase [Sulfuricaulis limicola]|uniref:UDP-N-acetylglucosamine--N-acetylmuramyl-(pentapeptide) pyrophosphoryl-undecaprenol N-acetylglucosamine transferase n=1 Tax=Sulfuricaulis limicola TaxID=1620215 RepID=A0A1B4XDI6_9GAMM|nr:undecaprenyldiphospho-muramoylpentapeptide beta-N-acetylglucosaminyltransferase [Sulfuricaulis limicola]BAV32873.1 UDP-diphospho-muramoylpentapeptide beta-N-acetylglucosaminyltransferase [Sulfuricaulis limicola]
MSRVLIMAGGTGGHVFPGLAVARRLLEKRVQVVWLGTRRGLEAHAVPASGLAIDMEWLNIQGVRRKGWLRWLQFPFTLAYAMAQAFRVLRRRKPDAVLSLGGFVAGPGGLMAWLTRTPLLIHEQNAIPGMTNKWLAPLADQVLSGFPNAFGRHVVARPVGNPVRDEIAALPPPEERLKDRRGRLRLLVVGGSLGARIFNDVMPDAVHELSADLRPEIWHQCGRGNAEVVQRAYGDVPAKVTEFIDDMAQAYAWADVVLCRAGAMTVAELAASGSAAILVPYLYAVDDHQTANARFLSERNAAVLVPTAEFNNARLCELLAGFSGNRELLLKMAQAARHLAVTDAAETVATLCLEAAT